MLYIKSVRTAKDYLCLKRKAFPDEFNPSSFFKGIMLLLIIFLLIPLTIFSQRKTDIGVFAGTSYYMGDLNPVRYLYSPGFAIGPIYRYNFDLRNSVRLSGTYHTLRGSDLDFTDTFQLQRSSSFQASFIDAAAMYEFNFAPYKTTHRKFNHTFYLSGGLGYHLVISSNTTSNNHITVPFSMGYKVNVTKKMAAGAELSVRKTFNDKIDGVENIGLLGKKHLFGNNDWYTFAGIFITYKIFNFREDCPAYLKGTKRHGNN